MFSIKRLVLRGLVASKKYKRTRSWAWRLHVNRTLEVSHSWAVLLMVGAYHIIFIPYHT